MLKAILGGYFLGVSTVTTLFNVTHQSGAMYLLAGVGAGFSGVALVALALMERRG